jgi:hypothetical protein
MVLQKKGGGAAFDFPGKYMDEYDLDFTRIFNADSSYTSTIQKCQQTLYRTGKVAALHYVM